MHIHGVIPFRSECQSDESGEFAIFHKIGCHGNVPSDIAKKGQIDHLHPKRFHSVKRNSKIGQVDPEIICLREIIKKRKKKKLTQAKCIARFGANNTILNVTTLLIFFFLLI